MFLKDFLYFITDKAGNSYRVNGGVVDTSGTPTPLPVTPSGWDEKSIKYGRSTKYFGLIRTFTTPLKFVKQGATILRDRLFRFGTEVELFLLIHRLDKTYGGEWRHRFFYKGEIDLSKCSSEENEFTANIMEGDLEKKFKANENTIYEIPIDVPQAVYVKMDGLVLQAVVTYAITKSLAAQSMGRKQMLPFVYVITEGNYFHLTFANDYGDMIDGAFNEITGEDLTTSGKWLYKATGPVRTTVRISGEIVGASGNAGNEWFVETSTGQVVSMGTIEHTLAGSPVAFDLSATVDLVEGETVFIYRSSTTFNNNGLWNYTDATKITVTTRDRADTTYIKALRPWYVAQQLLNKITGSEDYTIESNALDVTWSNLLITGFDAVRGLADAKMKISFSQLFEGYNVPANLALYVDGNILRIEEKTEVFDPATVTSLGDAKDLNVSPATDHQFNTLRIGYPDMKNDDINGRDEFNTQLTFTSPVVKVAKELAIVSPVFASMYEIELARINLNGYTNKNNDIDGNNAFLHVETSPTAGSGSQPAQYYKLLRNTYDSVTGILDPASAFNVELSPKRCIVRHGNYLRSVFYWHEAGKLIFRSGVKNVNLKTVKGAETVEEKADVTIGSLTDPLFVPLTANFKARIPIDLVDLMTDNPFRTFSFNWNGETFYGYVVDIGIQPSDNPEMEVALLLSPVNDLSKLIY